MMDIAITGGPSVRDGRITAPAPGRLTFDAAGLDILPGLIDVHGDAFERAIAPRSGITMPMPIALAELEAQLLAAGITTAYLAITLSWEAGLRSRAMYEALRDAVLARPPASVPDLKLHIRFEAHNIDCIELAIADIKAGHIAMLSFNDHTPGILSKLGKPGALARLAERAGQSLEDFAADARRAGSFSSASVALGRAVLAEAARAAGIPMASHDDESIPEREIFRALGAAISEFPMKPEVAADAISRGEGTVMGAPNVVRGGSHIGWHGAEALVKQGLCSVLCSDYHYPSMLHAPYRIARNQSAAFDDAIALVTRNAAKISGLADRGDLAIGNRADIILTDPGPDRATPKVLATIANGRLAYLAPEAAARLR